MSDFETKLDGTLYGLMRWQAWDALRNHLLTGAEPRWFAYAVGADLPVEPLPAIALGLLLEEIDALLR